MNISSKKRKNGIKIIIIILSIAIVVSGVVCGYFFWYQSSQSDETVDNQPNENSSISTDGNITPEPIRETSKEPLQNDSANVDQKSLTGYITYKNVENGKLIIRVQIDQFLTSGTCKITVGGYSEQVNIITNPSSSTCQGWDIQTSKLQNGNQKISIDINSGDNSLVISDEVTI